MDSIEEFSAALPFDLYDALSQIDALHSAIAELF
jgi:hypothetical protein